MISVNDISIQYINNLFNFIDNNKNNFNNTNYYDKILINAFFEPSTRTSLSFESAMYKLGGKVITFQKDSSSIKKGESFEDTIKTLSTYGDILVLRHPDIEFVKKAKEISNIPIINAGNGNGEHPTQALLDLYTIYKHLKENNINHHITNSINDNILNILFIGDIKNARTIHSLIQILKKYNNVVIDLLPYHDCEPDNNFINNFKMNVIDNNSIRYDKYQVIYTSRLQKERCDSGQKPHIIINNEFMKKVNNNCIIMHPLPRNEEIHPEVDDDPRCKYFKQMEYGILIRIGILHFILK